MTQPEKTNIALGISYADNNASWITSKATFRTIIGALGTAMPFLLSLLLYFDSGLGHPLDSISHYYFTRFCAVFVLIMGFLAIFLILYKGEASIDWWTTTIAGTAAVLLLLFPTSNISVATGAPTPNYVATILPPSTFRETFHYIASAVFLLSLCFMSLFLFTKSNKSWSEMGQSKRIRNIIYIVCGSLMFLAMLVIALHSFGVIEEAFYQRHQLTFWMESLAVVSFGISWLIKGEQIMLKD